MYSWPSSLVASITKLTGFEQNPSSFLQDFLGKLFFFFFFLWVQRLFFGLMIISLSKGFDSVDNGNGFVPLRW